MRMETPAIEMIRNVRQRICAHSQQIPKKGHVAIPTKPKAQATQVSHGIVRVRERGEAKVQTSEKQKNKTRKQRKQQNKIRESEILAIGRPADHFRGYPRKWGNTRQSLITLNLILSLDKPVFFLCN